MNHFDVSYGDEHEAPRFAKATQLALMLGSMQGSLDYAEARQEEAQKLKPQEWNPKYVEKIETEAVAFVKTDFVENKEWQKRIDQVFGKLRKLGGLYNSVTTSQAPTGSISQLLRVACTGVEPYFSMVQTRKVKDIDESWKEFTLVPLEFYGYSEEKLDWVNGQTAHEIDPHQQIRILEACQAFNHTAVSKTINLPASTTVDDIRAFLDYARQSNLKGITMFRDSSMEGVLSDKHSGHGGAEAPMISEFTDLDRAARLHLQVARPGPALYHRQPGQQRPCPRAVPQHHQVRLHPARYERGAGPGHFGGPAARLPAGRQDRPHPGGYLLGRRLE